MPLLIRGPGIPEGVAVSDISSNADLAPTILDAADAAGGARRRRALAAAVRRAPAAPARPRAADRAAGGAATTTTAARTGSSTTRFGTTATPTSRTRAARSSSTTCEAIPTSSSTSTCNPAYAEVEAALAGRLAALESCAGPSCRTKPSLKLRLKRARRENGRSCHDAKGFVAKVQGPAATGAGEVRFAVGSKPAGQGRLRRRRGSRRSGRGYCSAAAADVQLRDECRARRRPAVLDPEAGPDLPLALTARPAGADRRSQRRLLRRAPDQHPGAASGRRASDPRRRPSRRTPAGRARSAPASTARGRARPARSPSAPSAAAARPSSTAATR